ncbi:MAG: hypothetical protein K8S62_12995 [Candidatus Sabulitectum sp.]|nr:hypothetical protein [Candidatus Sabulitectum sp.]
MRRARVLMHGRFAGILEELVTDGEYKFVYQDGYDGPAGMERYPREKLPVS